MFFVLFIDDYMVGKFEVNDYNYKYKLEINVKLIK